MRETGRHKLSLSKKEILKGKKEIEGLFKNGSSFYLHPLLLKYQAGNGSLHQVLFTVSKKNFKRAVDRNLLKRRLREAFRLNKSLMQGKDTIYNLGFVYVGKTVLSYWEIEDKLKLLLKRLPNRGKTVESTN